MVLSPVVPWNLVVQPALKLLLLSGFQLLNRGIGAVFQQSSFQVTSGRCDWVGFHRADAFKLAES